MEIPASLGEQSLWEFPVSSAPGEALPLRSKHTERRNTRTPDLQRFVDVMDKKNTFVHAKIEGPACCVIIKSHRNRYMLVCTCGAVLSSKRGSILLTGFFSEKARKLRPKVSQL